MWELGENIFLSFYNYTPFLQKLNRDMEDTKIHTELIENELTIFEMKNTLDGMNDRLDTTEERINWLIN